MNELKQLLKEKIKYCCMCINNTSTREGDEYEASTIEHLARALFILELIEVEEK